VSDKTANIGNGIIVGHMDKCGASEALRTLHIWRGDMPHYSCSCIKSGCAPHGDLFVCYKDGESLQTLDMPLEKVEAFFNGNDRVYVHCAVGQTRSPTLALIGKVVRGASIYDAIGDVYDALWTQRGIVANLCLTPMKELLERYG